MHQSKYNLDNKMSLYLYIYQMKALYTESTTPLIDTYFLEIYFPTDTYSSCASLVIEFNLFKYNFNNTTHRRCVEVDACLG